MRWLANLSALGLVAASVGCSDDASGPEHVYTVAFRLPADVSLGQDSTLALAPNVVVLRDGQDTIPGSRVAYSSDDLLVAMVSPSGVVTGIGGGTTTIRVAFRADTLAIATTVRPRPTTVVDLRLHPTDVTPFYALPGHPGSTMLRALVMAGTDTVYCNQPVCSNTAMRAFQRFVRLTSLDPDVATIENSLAVPATRGQVVAKDTATARFVLEVPGDRVADTVTVRFGLRPIDSISIRVDSIIEGGVTRLYTGTLPAVVPRNLTLLLNVNYWNKVPGQSAAVAVTRPRLPLVTWLTASNIFAVITGDGRMTALKSVDTAPTCTNLNPQASQVVAGFGQPPGANVPTNCPTPAPPTIPIRPITCFRTSTSSTDNGASCTVYVKATITDPVSGLDRTAYLPVTIRQP